VSDADIIRRIAKRGLALAQQEGPQFIDLFQHLLDEIERCDILPKERACKTCQIIKRKRNAPRQRDTQPMDHSIVADGVGSRLDLHERGFRAEPWTGGNDVERPNPHDDDGK
jgi:hypothetical protein